MLVMIFTVSLCSCGTVSEDNAETEPAAVTEDASQPEKVVSPA